MTPPRRPERLKIITIRKAPLHIENCSGSSREANWLKGVSISSVRQRNILGHPQRLIPQVRPVLLRCLHHPCIHCSTSKADASQSRTIACTAPCHGRRMRQGKRCRVSPSGLAICFTLSSHAKACITMGMSFRTGTSPGPSV